MQPVREKSGDAIKFDPFIPPSTAELDALIPACKFVEFIECGGMGAVYKAVQKSLNRTVAVKLLPQVHRHKATFSERFTREAHALAQLNHPHIVVRTATQNNPELRYQYVSDMTQMLEKLFVNSGIWKNFRRQPKSGVLMPATRPFRQQSECIFGLAFMRRLWRIAA